MTLSAMMSLLKSQERLELESCHKLHGQGVWSLGVGVGKLLIVAFCCECCMIILKLEKILNFRQF
jgi:hypothetical protein